MRSRLISRMIRFSKAAKTVSVNPKIVQASDSDGKPEKDEEMVLSKIDKVCLGLSQISVNVIGLQAHARMHTLTTSTQIHLSLFSAFDQNNESSPHPSLSVFPAVDVRPDKDS